MTVPTPPDVTIGELWRSSSHMATRIDELVVKIDGLPVAFATELDKRDEAMRRETDDKLNRLTQRVDFHDRVIWGVVVFVLVGVGSAILAPIFK